MNKGIITSAESQVIDIIIAQCYRRVQTHQLESHLYAMFDTKKYEDLRSTAEELLGCINEYLYTTNEPEVNIEFKKGMDELNYWCKRLNNRLGEREGSDSQIASELLGDLIEEINRSEMKMKDNLMRLGLSA